MMPKYFRKNSFEQAKPSEELKIAKRRKLRKVSPRNSDGMLPTSPDPHHQEQCESGEEASFRKKLELGLDNFMTELQKRYPNFVSSQKFGVEKTDHPDEPRPEALSLPDSQCSQAMLPQDIEKIPNFAADNTFKEEELKKDFNNIHKRDLNPTWDQQETDLRKLAMPLMGKEQKKFAKAFRAISRIIYQSICESHTIEISPEGSYRHATNIPGSDLEIDIYFLNSPSPRSIAQFQEIRNLTENVLVGKYGREKVQRDNIVFNIDLGDSKVPVDILVAFLYKNNIEGKNEKKLEKMIKEFYNDKNKHFVDYVDQGHIDGVKKHKRTGRRFKAVVRILKKIRNEMRNSSDPVFEEASKNIPSLLIEAMVYHVPDSHFGHKLVKDDIKSILRYCIDHTRDDHGCKEWTRLYNPAPLFGKDRRQPGTQEELWTRERGWTREQAHKFLLAVQRHLEKKYPIEWLSEAQSQLRQQIEKVDKHIENFKKEMIDHKDALTYALAAICVKKQVFNDIIENAVSCCDKARGHINADQQDVNEPFRDHEIIQSINQRLDMIHERLLEKLTPVGSSAEEVEDRSSIEKGEGLGTDLQALFGMDREAVGNIEQDMERKSRVLEHKEWKNHSENIKYTNRNRNRKSLYRIFPAKDKNCAKNMVKGIYENIAVIRRKGSLNA